MDELSDTINTDLSVEEAAVVGVMRRSKMAKKAIYQYAINFTGSG